MFGFGKKDTDQKVGLGDNPSSDEINRILGRLPKGINPDQVTFEKGLPHHISLSLRDFLDHGQAILTECPTIVALTLHNLDDDDCSRLASSSLLNRITSLNLEHTGTYKFISAKGVASLIGSPNLTALTALNLANNKLGDRAAELLAASHNMHALTKLTLAHNKINYRGAASLAASRHLTGLHILDLGYNNIGSRGIAALAASTNLNTLTALHLGAIPGSQ